MAIIYGVAPSPYVRKTMLAHAYKDVPYEFKLTPPGTDEEDFRKASPLGKVPGYLTDNGTAFSDSSVIIAYIERTSTSIKLYPENAEYLALALWLEEYCDTKMMEATAALYFQRIIGPMFFQHTTDDARVEEVLTSLLPPVLDYVESKIIDGQWLINNTFSVADISLGTCLINLFHSGYELDIHLYPKLNGYNTRFMALDFVKAQIDTEKAMFAS